MKVDALRHTFVDMIPKELDDGTIYLSITYATAVHNCCCGCGNEVVTPLSRTDWRLIFDGETVSLEPSIGNWSFPCQSHYWILHNRVRWARSWTAEEIDHGRQGDPAAKKRSFDHVTRSTVTDTTRTHAGVFKRMLTSLKTFAEHPLRRRQQR